MRGGGHTEEPQDAAGLGGHLRNILWSWQGHQRPANVKRQQGRKMYKMGGDTLGRHRPRSGMGREGNGEYGRAERECSASNGEYTEGRRMPRMMDVFPAWRRGPVWRSWGCKSCICSATHTEHGFGD